jgi:hypothetical protein
MIKTVKATREGLVGSITASGYIIDSIIPFVALPDVKALHKFVRITKGTKSVIAIVLDVGPWNTHDDLYVFGLHQPQSETGTDIMGRKTNSSGIDLGERVWNELGMTDNGLVTWEFIE